MYNTSLPIVAEFGYFQKNANTVVKPKVLRSSKTAPVAGNTTVVPTAPKAPKRNVRAKGSGAAPKPTLKQPTGFMGKALRIGGGASSILGTLGLLGIIFGKDQETRLLEEQVRWAMYRNKANERYNKAMYPDYF